VAVVAILFLLRGALALLVRPRLLLIPALLTVAALLSIGQSVAAGTLLLMWYLLPVVIGWVVILGAGLTSTRNQGGPAWRRWSGWVFPLTVLACLSIWTSVSVAMVQIPRQPMREAGLQSVAFPPWPGVRLYLDGPKSDEPAPASANDFLALTAASNDSVLAVMGISDQQMKLYAPKVMVLKSMEDLEKAEAAAAHQGKRLWVSVGGWKASQERMPEVMARLTGGTYEKTAELPGWEPMFSYQLWRQR